VASNSVQHTYEEWHEWLVEELEGHVVELNMYDQDSSSSDEFLGFAALDLATLSQTSHQFNGLSLSGRKKEKPFLFEPNVIK